MGRLYPPLHLQGRGTAEGGGGAPPSRFARHLPRNRGGGERARLSMWPSVWSLSRPEPSHTTWLKPRPSRNRCSVCSRVSVLRLGLSRHCSVVMTVPEPSWSIAPPSRIQSALANGSPVRLA